MSRVFLQKFHGGTNPANPELGSVAFVPSVSRGRVFPNPHAIVRLLKNSRVEIHLRLIRDLQVVNDLIGVARSRLPDDSRFSVLVNEGVGPRGILRRSCNPLRLFVHKSGWFLPESFTWNNPELCC